MDLDAVISQMEQDLAELKKARDLAQRYQDQNENRPHLVRTPAVRAPVPTVAADSQDNVQRWHHHLSAVFAKNPTPTAKEIHAAVNTLHHEDVAYNTIYAYLRRKVEAEEYEYDEDEKIYSLPEE